jgi:peptidylprolyl isomerase
MGAGQLIKGFEGALEGMALNEKKTFILDPEDAYGHRKKGCVHSFDKSEIPAEMNPEVGQTVALSTAEGRQIPAHITAIDDKKITVDLNHPLAGQSLTFEIEVVGISETATQQHGGCDHCSCEQD